MNTNEEIGFEEWYDGLCAILDDKGHRDPDRDTAEDDYNHGMSYEDSAQSFIDDWEG